MRHFFFGLLSLIAILSLTPKASAASLTINNIPPTVDHLQEFSVNASLSCLGCGDSYLRGVFYPSGSSYFGYTQDNSGNFSNASGASCTTFFKVGQSDLQEGSWSGTLKFKPDIDSIYYNGPGGYLFKIGRYTPSCGSPSVWSTETTIAITGPTPTPSPTPTPAPTSTPAPTPAPSHTLNPTIKPTVKPAATPASSPIKISLKSSLPRASVAGEYDISAPEAETSPKPSPTVLQSKNKDSGLIFKLLLLAGGILILASALFFLPRILEHFFNKNKL